MKLATGGASLYKCPYLSPEVKAKLEDLLAPAIKLVTIGTGDNKVQVGNEEVIYRHEKTYIHPPGIGLLISDKEGEAKADEKIKKVKELQFPWVGLTLKAELLALQFESGDKEKGSPERTGAHLDLQGSRCPFFGQRSLRRPKTPSLSDH
jgi:acetyl-CoA decarbonylase/synthase complex subunit gamma